MSSTSKGLSSAWTSSAEKKDEDGRVKEVIIDGLALLKLVKHCTESLPNIVAGALLGLDSNSKLEVTHCIPIPDNDEEKVFQLEMMKLLREINVDNNCIGWYKTVYGGSFCQMSLVETQMSYQTNLSENCIVLLFDPSHITKLWLRAFQLSSNFIQEPNSFLPASDLLVELPVTIRNSSLISAFLFDTVSSLYPISSIPHDCQPGSKKFQHTLFDQEQDAQIYLEQTSNWIAHLTEDTNQNTYLLKSNFDHRASNASSKQPQISRLDNLLISFQINEYCNSLGFAARSDIYHAHTAAQLISGVSQSSESTEGKTS
uniref:MPN domain-containing protein n=1 Tax=Aureoumbra lagunensis TaxID=44058 RepID=A0A7S3K5N9_9STRA|mmetsp:Transcript_7740/g.10781  ORF Transcript_7740/g.10781 Transcript_7740/m.10781 type:complete len:315 (+) Transcript_7740:29-973(+)